MFKQKAHIEGTLSLQKISRSHLPLKKGRTSLTVFSLDAFPNKAKPEAMKRNQTYFIPLTRVLFNIVRGLPEANRVQVFAL
jgi:hypothetical protein